VKLLDGWKEIQAEYERVTGRRRSLRSLQRLAVRRNDPLPTSQAPDGGGRIAYAERIQAWWERLLNRVTNRRRYEKKKPASA